MNLGTIFQLRTKKFWWMDVIFYFVISLLLATLFCWIIFLVKDSMIKKEIEDVSSALLTVGTQNQQDQEKDVIDYRNKINDFADLLKNHEFASNALVFIKRQTMPNIWFKQFGLSEKNAEVQLSGETDDMDSLSRQVANFEKNKYVKNIGNLNSSLGASARVAFNINLSLDKNIFSYLSDMTSISETTTPSEQLLIQQGQTVPPNGQQNPQSPGVTPSSEKLITSFHLLLNPEIIGAVDETNYTVTLNVPYGTDVKNLTSAIVISPGAAVSPASGVLQDFTNPVTYVVTAEDGSLQNYAVKVIVAAPPVTAKKPGQSGLGVWISIIVIIIMVTVAAVLFLRKRSKKQRADINTTT